MAPFGGVYVFSGGTKWAATPRRDELADEGVPIEGEAIRFIDADRGAWPVEIPPACGVRLDADRFVADLRSEVLGTPKPTVPIREPDAPNGRPAGSSNDERLSGPIVTVRCLLPPRSSSPPTLRLSALRSSRPDPPYPSPFSMSERRSCPRSAILIASSG